MAKQVDSSRPYTNLKSYLEYKQRGSDALKLREDEIINLLEENGFKVEVINYVDYLSGKIQHYQFFGQIFVIAKKIKS